MERELWALPFLELTGLYHQEPPRPVVNHGETIYWSFTEPVSSAREPVIISLSARNISSGQVLGSSSLTLGWEGNFTVILQNTR